MLTPLPLLDQANVNTYVKHDTIIEGKGIFLHYKSYSKWIKEDTTWKQKAATMSSITINNPEGIMITRGVELPLNGVLFEEMESLSVFKEAKELYLWSLHIKDIPESFTDLTKLEKLELAFTCDANMKHVVEVLSKLPSLKELSVAASTLKTKDRKKFKQAMEKRGIHFFGVLD